MPKQTDDERRVKHAAYMREWYRRHPGYGAKHPEWQQRWRAQNPEKQAEYQEKYADATKARYRANPEPIKKQAAQWHRDNRRKAQLIAVFHRNKKAWGLTREVFDTLVPRLDGPCEICGKLERMHIDHHHSSKTFRGLLCNNCNTGIGLLNESVELLQRAIAYLQQRNPIACPPAA